MWRTWANEEFFGRQAGGRGESAFAQARVVALAECGTHAVFGAVIGPAVGGRAELSRQLFPQLGEGKLLLADQGFYGFELWQTARATGADLLWRLRSSAAVPGLQVLDDGSYLSSIRAEADRTVLTAGPRAPTGVTGFGACGCPQVPGWSRCTRPSGAPPSLPLDLIQCARRPTGRLRGGCLLSRH